MFIKADLFFGVADSRQ